MGQVQTVSVPVFGQVLSRDAGATDYGQVFTNVHFLHSQNQITGGGEVALVSQEGYAQHATIPAAASAHGTAVKIWQGNGNAIASAYGTPNSTVYVNTTSYGALTGICGFLSESVDGAGTAVLWAVSESNRGYYSLAGVMTLIADVDFPPNQAPARTITGNFVHFSGFSGIMCTDGTFWHNQVGTPATWTNSAYLTAQDSPDAGVAAIKHGEYLILFGKSSMEPHTNTGNATGAVISRVPGAAKPIGLVNQYSAVQFMDSVAFVGASNGASVYMLRGLEPVRISTYSIETLLRQNSNNCRLHVITSRGRPRLLLTLDAPASCLSGYLYDPDTQMWSKTLLNFYFTQSDTLQLLDGTVKGAFFAGINAAGRVYHNSESILLAAVAQTAPLDLGTGKKKILHEVRVIGESFAVATVNLSYSDDGGVTFSTARPLELGRIYVRQLVGKAQRLGVFTERTFKLAWTDPGSASAVKIKRLEFDFEVLA